MIALALVGIISSMGAAAYSNYINTAESAMLTANFDLAVDTVQNNYVAATQLQTMGAATTRYIPPDSQGWVDLLSAMDAVSPTGDDAFSVGMGDTNAASIGILFSGNFSDNNSIITLFRPAFRDLPASSTVISQADF